MRRGLTVYLLVWISVCIGVSAAGEKGFRVEREQVGKVLELDDSNFESAISSIDFIFVDFYAPWCGHCKRLSPELDAAATILSEQKEPIVIAKMNAEKYRRLADKYDVDGYPTLKIFMHGVPVDYYGPRKADLLVRYLKKFVAPDVAILDSDSAIGDFVLEAGSFFPIFIGFGMNETEIAKLGTKYKKKAWFSVAKDFSEDVMSLYDFDKTPALISLLPSYNEKSIFYGPFEEQFLEDFVKQSFLPLAVPMNHDTLKVLKEDNRKIVLSIVEDESDENTQKFIKLLKAAASANRDLVFGYVGVRRWAEFAETFGVTKKTKLPTMVVWNGDEEYLSVIGSESIGENEDQGSQISLFLQGYRERRTIQKTVSGPSLMSYINSLIGIRTVYIIVFMVAVLMVLQAFGREEPLRVGTREEVDQAAAAAAPQGEVSEHAADKKED